MGSTPHADPSGDQPTSVDATVSRSERRALEPGTMVGRYLLVDRLGAGGMGEVYAAYDPELDRRVAIKLVHDELVAAHSEMQTRLVREAQALAKLSHPSVVAVYDAGAHGRRVYIAMEFVEGQTLRAWTDRREPKPRDLLAVLLEAGRGLAAAHEAGLVHRDFKPSNVMVHETSSGTPRVRVLDFGLARRWDDEADDQLDESLRSVSIDSWEEHSGRQQLSAPLTRTGTVMGTPAYMAPEQFAGRRVEAPADQFAFCVVAYRLLYGAPPFGTINPDELPDAVLRGEVVSPPRKSAVPWGVWPILERGLRREPRERWSTMDDLLERLERVLGAPKRWMWLGLGAATVGLAAAGVVLNSGAAPCSEVDTALSGVWDAESKAGVERAFDATGVAYAEDAWTGVQRRLDAYAAEYGASRQEACEATYRGEQSSTLMDLRMACLDKRRVELEAMVGLLQDADSTIVHNALQAVGRLDPLGRCADVEALTAPVEPPSSGIAGEVQELEREIAAIRAQMYAGKYTEAVEAVEPLVQRVDALGYDPLTSDAQWLRGATLERMAQPERCVEAYEQAVIAGARSGDRTAEAKGIIGLVSVIGGQLTRVDEARRLARLAEATVESVGNPPKLVATLELYRGTAEYRVHEFAAAEKHFRRALEVAGDDASMERVRIAALNNLAGATSAQGRFTDALEIFEEATRVVEAQLGPLHPIVANLYNNLGVTYLKLQRYDEAREALDQSLTRYKTSVGTINGEVARSQHNLGLALENLGRHEDALAAYREAYAAKRDTFGEKAHTTAFSANNIGMMLHQLGRRQESLEWLERALEIFEAAQGPKSADRLYSLSSLAEIHLEMRHLDEAQKYADLGMEIAESGKVELAQRGEMRFIYAQLQLARGNTQRAVELARGARTDYEESERPAVEELAKIDRWLAKR